MDHLLGLVGPAAGTIWASLPPPLANRPWVWKARLPWGEEGGLPVAAWPGSTVEPPCSGAVYLAVARPSTRTREEHQAASWTGRVSGSGGGWTPPVCSVG